MKQQRAERLSIHYDECLAEAVLEKGSITEANVDGVDLGTCAKAAEIEHEQNEIDQMDGIVPNGGIRY